MLGLCHCVQRIILQLFKVVKVQSNRRRHVAVYRIEERGALLVG